MSIIVLIYQEVEEVTVKPTVLKLDRGPYKLKIDPVANRIYISNKNSNSILVIDCQSDRLLERIKMKAPRGGNVIATRTIMETPAVKMTMLIRTLRPHPSL